MGFAGPALTTKPLFGTADDITINPGFTHGSFTSTARLVTADLSAAHQRNQDQNMYAGDNFGGHHSDINFSELYELIAAFLFK